MNADAPAGRRVEELELQVADLAEQVEQLTRWRKLDHIYVDEIEIRAEERGFKRGLNASRHGRTRPAQRPVKGSHLRLVRSAP